MKEKIGRWLTYALGMAIGAGIGIFVLGALALSPFLGSLWNEATFTQRLFAACLVLFGPAFGAIAASIIFYRGGVTGPALGGAASAFLFATTTAYTGWMLGGMMATNIFPSYPANSPGELIASAFTLPGFLTGAVAIIAMVLLHNRPSYGKCAATMLGATVVGCVGILFVI